MATKQQKQKTITLQTTNVDPKVKEKADKVARRAGFGGVHDVVRLVLHDVAAERLPLKMGWSTAKNPEIREAINEYIMHGGEKLPTGMRLSEYLRPGR